MTENSNVLDMISRLSRLTRRSHGKGHSTHRGRFRVLRVLKQEGSLLSKDLAEKLDIRPSSLFEALNHLEEKELIVRITDEADKHKVIGALGDKANDWFQQKQDRKDERQALIDQEKEEFLRLSNKIIDALKQEKSVH